MSNEASGAEALLRMLELHGVRTVFGLCGDTSLPLYDAMYRDGRGIRHVLTRDERSAAYMADGYARVTGKVGVCEGPSGGGATYLLPGIVEANESSVPILGITSDVSVASRGRFPLTELDQQSLYRPLTKWNTVLDRSADVPKALRAAFRAMTTGKPGSAHIGLPFDVQTGAVPEAEIWGQPEHGTWPAWRSVPAPDEVERAAALMVAARRPVFLVGGGVLAAGAMDALAALAEALDAPVATTVSGKGAIAETHPLAAGVVGSNGGVLATRAVIDAADLVVIVGCRAGSTSTEHWRHPGPGAIVVHLDVDPAVIAVNYRTDVALVGDARLGLEALGVAVADRLKGRGERSGEGRASVALAKEAKWSAFHAIADGDERPIRPERLIRELRAALPADAIVVADPGTPCPYVSAYFELPRAGRHFLTNRAHGALGWSMSAATGAAIGRPEAKVVAIMGDGSFGFTVGELETIARLKVPIVMIVVSNAVFGWIKASQKAGYDARYFSVDFTRTDHAAIARAYGVTAHRVEDPAALGETLRAAIAHDGPVVIDVISQPLQDAAAPVSQWMG
ncbi:thiamine pyrophosphate-binding protein [Pinisolibacter aquiterrae]|uniref:thiamine pyrophosphate-binding protein n=1 Tax=Pinisolibacter aquiterrae TaxID=2815579 RepID=UPI001C3D7762|nr:thiamine pyrophosphate-binding protein [Pinisolibacter aquiterrae]MBV5263744.1 thiamine pyrophosphate-binding protein [Pinisolibacter aquiterrae]MCC8235058.1 thiamine pyrophosphate-binding protein [Pinisolibacter aquiterrae]